MALLNTGHLLWWLRRQIAGEDPAIRAELAHTIDRCSLELNTANDEIRRRAIARLLDLAYLYEHRDGYRPEEWGSG